MNEQLCVLVQMYRICEWYNKSKFVQKSGTHYFIQVATIVNVEETHFPTLVTNVRTFCLDFCFAMDVFNNRPGFCPTCGSILPPLQVKGNVLCYNCKQEFDPEGKQCG